MSVGFVQVRCHALHMVQDTKKRDLRAGVMPVGRVVRERGQSVWQWTEEEASSGSTSVLLQFLDNDALSLEPTQAVPIPSGALPEITDAGSTETTSAMLRRLDNGQFSIEPTWSVPVPEGLRETRARVSKRRDARTDDGPEDALGLADESFGGGFNPYDHS